MKKNILAIIPARRGSKGVKHKNRKLLAAKPLIRYTIDAAKKSKFITRIILSSDDRKIINYCKSFGIEVPFFRPATLSGDNVPMSAVIMHAVNFLWSRDKYMPDYIILLQPTSPLRKARQIEEALKLLLKSGADSVVSVVEVPHNFNPYSVMKLKGGILKPFLPCGENMNLRQKKPRFFARNGPAILAFKSSCLLKDKTIFGKKTIPYFMKKEDSIDIDDYFDFEIAERLIKHRSNAR